MPAVQLAVGVDRRAPGGQQVRDLQCLAGVLGQRVAALALALTPADVDPRAGGQLCLFDVGLDFGKAEPHRR